MADLKAFADQLVNLTVKEVNELAQILKDVYGIEPAAAAVAVAAPSAGGGDDADRMFEVIEVTGRQPDRSGQGRRHSTGCRRRRRQHRQRHTERWHRQRFWRLLNSR